MKKVLDALTQYGATLSNDGLIQRSGKTMPVFVTIKKDRIRFESTSSNLLASGPVAASTVEKFVESFWFWEKTK